MCRRHGEQMLFGQATHFSWALTSPPTKDHSLFNTLTKEWILREFLQRCKMSKIDEGVQFLSVETLGEINVLVAK